MKSAKIILGSAALLITVTSSLAFKVANKFSSKRAHVQLPGKCVTCDTTFIPISGGVHHTKCRTKIGNALVTGRGSNHWTFFTSAGTGIDCSNPTTKVTQAL